jgi:hypothetical protein
MKLFTDMHFSGKLKAIQSLSRAKGQQIIPRAYEHTGLHACVEYKYSSLITLI